MLEIDKLDGIMIIKCSKIFDEHPQTADSDRAIRKIVNAYPNNNNLPDVLAKVSIIKTLYATPLYDVFSMAKYIVSIDGLDSMLEKGDRLAVERIRKCEEIKVKKTQKVIDFYSFATKYCSFHNLNAYPIYDNLVVNLQLFLNSKYGWIKGLTRGRLLDYSEYITLVDCCLNSMRISEIGYKAADKGLWVLAKYHALHNEKNMSKFDRILIDEVSRII